jgi:hypothetical protein
MIKNVAMANRLITKELNILATFRTTSNMDGVS